jgi:hypothetical protein
MKVPEWRAVAGSAMMRRQTGDTDGAILDMVKAVGLTRQNPKLAEQTASLLNYLADLYLDAGADDQAEAALSRIHRDRKTGSRSTA